MWFLKVRGIVRSQHIRSLLPVVRDMTLVLSGGKVHRHSENTTYFSWGTFLDFKHVALSCSLKRDLEGWTMCSTCCFVLFTEARRGRLDHVFNKALIPTPLCGFTHL